MAILLDKWDAIELFCRIISKYDKKVPIEELRDNNKLKNRLNYYSQLKNNHLVGGEVFGWISKEDKKSNKPILVPAKPTPFYELCRQINHSEPVVMTEEIFDQFVRYINVKDFAEHTKIQLQKFNPSQKQRDIEGTKWSIYFYDEYNGTDNEGSPKLYKGVSRGILYLKPFGKAELTRLKKETNEFRVYFGIYRVCKNDEYIVLKMKLKGTRERDLRLLIYIGTDSKVNLALGLSSNISDSIYARSVVIENFADTPDNNINVGFYSREQEESKNQIFDVPPIIYDYLLTEDKKIIRLPARKITSLEKLAAWVNEK